MCMEDIRLGRRSPGSYGDSVIQTTVTLYVPPDRHRTALILWGPATGSVELSTNPTFAAGQGFHLGSGEGGVVLNVQHHGDIVRRAWYATHSVGGVNLHWEASSLYEE